MSEPRFARARPFGMLPVPVEPPTPPVVPPVVPPIVAPPPPLASVRDVTDRMRVLDMRASFGNFREHPPTARKGEGIIYTPAIPAVWRQDKPRMRRWLDTLAARGNTHLVIGDFEGGPGYGGLFQFPDYTAELGALREMVDELTHLPAADGDGWRLMIQMDGGSDGYQERMRKWPRIVEAISPFALSCLWSPGWELIKASSWSSKDFSDGATLLRSLLGPEPIMIAHMSPDRAAFSSHPLEADDPWQGAESGCWRSYGGEHFAAVFHQLDPPHPSDRIQDCRATIDSGNQLHCSQHADTRDGDREGSSCWLDRVWDSLSRLGAGRRGWRKLDKWILGETCIYRGWHEGLDVDAFGTLIADVVERELLPHVPGITIGFGNGLPSRLRR